MVELSSTVFYGLDLEELAELLVAEGLSRNHARTLFNWFYKQKKFSLEGAKIPARVQTYLRTRMDFRLPEIVQVQKASDRTVKFLLKLRDGHQVETVLLPFQGKYTVCLSSQVGCAMRCSFCYTGLQGLKRHLKTEEIISQFMLAYHWLAHHRPEEARILNVVFMGQGEPLHNFDEVRKSCEILLSRYGLCLADHKITISTAGYLPGLKRFREEMPPVNIALSLHSVIKEKRDQLIPLNQRYDLHEVMNEIVMIPQGKKRFITFEYLLIDSFNDSPEEAHLTGKFLQNKKAIVSLIPFNPFPGTSYQKPGSEKVEIFQGILSSYGLPALVRGTKGDDILAACGQLNSATATSSHSVCKGKTGDIGQT